MEKSESIQWGRKVHRHVQGSISGRDTKGTAAILWVCFSDTTTVEECSEYDENSQYGMA